VDADPSRRLLHDRLRLLARRVDRGLEEHAQALAVLGPDAVGAALPAAVVEDRRGLLEAELPARVSRPELRRRVQIVRRRLGEAAVDLLLDRRAVDQEAQGRAPRAGGP